MAILVIDANLAVVRIVPTEFMQEVHELFRRWAEQRVELGAPPHFFSEVMNTLRGKVVRRELTGEEGEEALELFERLQVIDLPVPRPFRLAWELAKEYGLPATYDAEYMALAQLHDCEFWTADRRFLRVLGNRRPSWVRPIGVFPSPPSP